MTMFDYCVFAVIMFSVLLGAWRGFVYEVLSMLGWVAAYVVARTFASSAVWYMPDSLQEEGLRTAVAFTVLFIIVLLVWAVFTWALSGLVKFIGLRWMDSFFGALFGVLRGLMLVVACVLLAGLTKIPQEQFWQNAWLHKPIEDLALTVKAWLPEDVAKRIKY
ncbi:MAG: CvpA family protein [Pseudomonadota bacterium]